jgi:hypothetical protein
MKRTIILLALVFVTLAAACQPKDKVFPTPIWLNGGFYVGTDPVLHLTLPSGGGGSTAFSAITGKPTTLAGYGITDAALATHNHSALYKPIAWFPTYSEVTGKPILHIVATSGSYNDLKDVPAFMELKEALPTLPGIKLPVLTQAQINALVPVEGLEVVNKTDTVLQIFLGGRWKIIPTTN